MYVYFYIHPEYNYSNTLIQTTTLYLINIVKFNNNSVIIKSMSIESSLPREAFEEMAKEFEGHKPVISNRELLRLCSNSENLVKLYEDMMNYAVRYAEDVWSMHLFISTGQLDTEKGAKAFSEMDDARTRLHNTLVDSIAILSRNLAKEGVNNEWVRELTSNGTQLERASCGRFALQLVFDLNLDKY